MKGRTCCGLVVITLMSGCASYKNELVFGESSDFSIGLHPAPAGGLDFNLGYKQTDIAVVPVAVLDSSREIRQRRAKENEDDDKAKKDAISVFGQFSASSTRSPSDGEKPPRVTFGRFFATGMAAQNLAEGYANGWKAGVSAQDPTAAAAAAKAAADAAKVSADAAKASAESAKASTVAATAPQASADAAKASADAAKAAAEAAKNSVSGADARVTQVATEAGKAAGAKAAQDALAQGASENTPNTSVVLPPLVFGQYDMVGLNLAYSATPSAVDFAVGYSGRNIAIMPVFGEGKDGFHGLGSGVGKDANDSYSVVGQFSADTATNAPDVGLNRFFATGVAAQKLSEGLKTRIAAFIGKQTKADLTGTSGSSGK